MDQLEKEFAKQIAEFTEQLSKDVTNGMLSPEEYKRQCGRIGGLRESVSLLEQARKDINKRHNGEK